MSSYSFDKDDFLSVFPGFTSVSDTAFNFQLEFAQRIVSSYLSNRADVAEQKEVLYYVLAYLLSLYIADIGSVATGVGTGIVSSASEGSVSVGFTLPALAQTWWGKNSFGLMALMLLRKYTHGAILVNGDTEEDIVDV